MFTHFVTNVTGGQTPHYHMHSVARQKMYSTSLVCTLMTISDGAYS